MIFDCQQLLKNTYLYKPEYKLIFKTLKVEKKNLFEAVLHTDLLTSVKHFISQSNHYHFLTSNESLKKNTVKKSNCETVKCVSTVNMLHLLQ